MVNTAMADAWNGYEGAHWAAHADRYEAINGGFNDVLLDAAAIGEHDRVLDIGCGSGPVTRLAARRARLGRANGVDLSGPMLARARGAAESIPNLCYEQGDAQVHPWPTDAFDVAISRFGVMFFDDPVAAFANVRRGLRPVGRLAILTMTAMTGTDLGLVLDSMAPYLPRPTAADGTGPTSLGDPARIREVLNAAGFVDIDCSHVEADMVWGRDAEDAARFIASMGPVKYQLDQIDSTAGARAIEALTAALRRYDHQGSDGPEVSGRVRLRGTAWLATATAA